MSRSPKAILDQFREVKLSASLEALAPDQRRALTPLLRAARAMDEAFMRQMGPGIVELAKRFEGEQTPEASAFRLFKSPFDKLDDDRAFIAGATPARPGRALYPEDLTVEQLEDWIASHPADKEALLDPYTVVRRNGEKLEAIPYAQAFSAVLAPAIRGLEDAAKVVGHSGLAAFLEGRAAALAGRKPMRDSDAEWVRLKLPPLEVVVGPYEVYQDHLRGVKAFYEGMLLAVLPDECERVTMIEQGLGALAAAIPCPEGSRSAVGGMAPLLVADELIATGDGASGIHSVAFNLPNDPWVRGNVGWKQIMIRNMMRAKFEHCASPIAERVLARDQLPSLSFDAFFYFVLLHEVTHGLGPAYRADGRSVNEACGVNYSPLEEAKADTGGLVLLLSKGGEHGIPAIAPERVGVSYLAGLYRSSRFGLAEAHGKANVIQYSFLKEQGALQLGDGRVRVDAAKLPAAAGKLLQVLTRLQAAGSPEEIARFLARYATPPAELLEAIRGLADLPVDIRPIWPDLES